jgi:hypothetical protein
MKDSVQIYLKKRDIHHEIVDTGDDEEMCTYIVQGNLCKIEIRIGYPITGERKAITVLALSPANVSQERLIELFNLTNHVNRINSTVTMMVGPSNGSYWARSIIYPSAENFENIISKVEGVLCSIIDQTFPVVMKIEHERIDFVRAWEFMGKSKTSDESPIDSDDSPDMFG